MKKRTKFIATVIAMVLVVSAMVVGIYAATSATAQIGASVTWSATAGLNFDMSAYIHNTESDIKNNSTWVQLFAVDSQTSNSAVSGVSKTLNASFYDNTDDGVNNPYCLYYEYDIIDYAQNLKFKLTTYPVSNAQVKVEWAHEGEVTNGWEPEQYDYVETIPSGLTSGINVSSEHHILIKLTIINPDVSVASFNAGITIQFSKQS